MNITLRLLSTIAIFGFSLTATNPAEEVAQGIVDSTQESVAPKKEKIAPAADATNTPAKAVITEVSMDELEKLLGKTIIVDARGSGDEIIPGATFIAANADDRVIAAKLPNKKAEIVIYCGSIKCPASMTLAKRLVALGYKNVKHYAGGIAEWIEKNKSTTKISK